tara:strand:- start:1223 stop:1996 length:774 start_codon:yes stop_codon:yes gene_type:complete
MSVIITDEERARWTIPDDTHASNDEVLCECISISKSEKIITPKGKSKPVLAYSFVMKLVVIATGEEVTAYFNFNKSKKGHATVKHDGKFAMLYRLTFGSDPRKRYSQAQHLVNHFLGEQFLVTYEIANTRENETYRKATRIKPSAPIVFDGWTNTGRLRHKFTPRKKPGILGKAFDEPLTVNGKVFESSLMVKAETPHSYSASPSVSITSKGLQANEQVYLEAVDNSNVNYEEHANIDYPASITIINNQLKKYTEYF